MAKWADADQSNVNNWRTDPATGQVFGTEARKMGKIAFITLLVLFF